MPLSPSVREQKQRIQIMTSHTFKAGEEEYELALKYENGDGVEQDIFKATEYLQKAAMLKHTGAIVKLGKAYQCGHGVMRNAVKAIEMFKQASSMGDSCGTVELGQCYERGIGVKRDGNEAMKLYTQAAKQGNGEAMYNLGCMLFFGWNVKEDKTSGVEWWKQASEHGNVIAIKKLCECYENGNGVPKDVGKVIHYLTMGTDCGDKESTVVPEILSRGLHKQSRGGDAKIVDLWVGNQFCKKISRPLKLCKKLSRVCKNLSSPLCFLKKHYHLSHNHPHTTLFKMTCAKYILTRCKNNLIHHV